MRKADVPILHLALLFALACPLWQACSATAQSTLLVRCTGAVIDAKGQPIANAKVTMYEMLSDGVAGNIILRPVGSLTTPANGTFGFGIEPKPAQGTFLDAYLVATKRGLAVGWTALFTHPADPGAGARFRTGQTNIRIILPTEARIEGRIVDTLTGKGVPGVKLAVVAQSSPAFFDRFVCISGEDGMFTIGGLRSGEYLIHGAFPSVEASAVAGVLTKDILIGVDAQYRTQPQPPAPKRGQAPQVYIAARILEMPADTAGSLLEPNVETRDVAFPRLVVRTGQEIADKLLEVSRSAKNSRLLSSPRILTFAGQEAVVAIGRQDVTYIAGYEAAQDGSENLTPLRESWFVGMGLKITAETTRDPDRTHVALAVKQQENHLQTRQYRRGYDVQTPSPGTYFSAEAGAGNDEPVVFGVLRANQPSLYVIVTPNCWSAPREPEPLIGKPLPKFDNIQTIGPEPAWSETEGKSLLICFWDMQQRPSRNAVVQLAKQTEQLQQKGVAVVAIQASKMDEAALRTWLKENSIPLPVGMIQADEEKTRSAWGAKSLPWLILTDKNHIVTAEGFAMDELDKKIAGDGAEKR